MVNIDWQMYIGLIHLVDSINITYCGLFSTTSRADILSLFWVPLYFVLQDTATHCVVAVSLLCWLRIFWHFCCSSLTPHYYDVILYHHTEDQKIFHNISDKIIWSSNGGPDGAWYWPGTTDDAAETDESEGTLVRLFTITCSLRCLIIIFRSQRCKRLRHWIRQGKIQSKNLI